jgi:hypothetical protein
LKECKVAKKLLEIIEVKSQEPVSFNYSKDVDNPPVETPFLCFNDDSTLDFFSS